MNPIAFRAYRYVGPDHLWPSIVSPSKSLKTHDQLLHELKLLGIGPGKNEEKTVTFVVDIEGDLRIAYRQSEHVRCAGGENVLSAGEMTFIWTSSEIVADWTTNQSTGYCPEPESWAAVKRSLDRIGVDAQDEFSMALIFRRCEKCRQINIVKDCHYFCEVCESTLPLKWNFENSCF